MKILFVLGYLVLCVSLPLSAQTEKENVASLKIAQNLTSAGKFNEARLAYREYWNAVEQYYGKGGLVYRFDSVNALQNKQLISMNLASAFLSSAEHIKDKNVAYEWLKEGLNYALPAQQVFFYLHLGTNRLMEKEYETARECLSKAYDFGGEAAKLAAKFMGHAYSMEVTGLNRDPKQQLAYYEKSTDWYKRAESLEQCASGYRNMARIYRKVQDKKQSEKYFNMALDIYTGIGNVVETAKTRGDYGDLLEDKGLVKQALNEWKQAYTILLEQKEWNDASIYLQKLINLYAISLNNPQKGALYLEEWRKILPLQDPQDFYQDMFYGVCQTMASQRADYETALAYSDSCNIGGYGGRSFQSGIDSLGMRKLYLRKRTFLYAKLGREEDVRRSCSEIIRMSSFPGYPEQSRLSDYEGCGSLLLSAQLFSESISYLENALSLSDKLYSKDSKQHYDILRNLAIARANLKEYDKALILWEKCLKLAEINYGKNSLETEFCRFARANTYALSGNLQKGKSDFTIAFGILGNVVKRYFTFMTEKEREMFWIGVRDDMMKMIGFGYKAGALNDDFTGQMYNSLLFTKGLLLNSSAEVGKIVEQYPDVRMLHIQLDSLEKMVEKNRQGNRNNLQQLQLERENKESEMMAVISKYPELYASLQIDYKQVQRELTPQGIAIEFTGFNLGKDTVKYVALVLRKGERYPRMISLFDEKEILSALQTEDLSKSLSGKKAELLAEKIFTPLKPYLVGVKDIYFSPGGLFCQLPIEYLEYEENRLFCESFKTHRLSSTRELVCGRGKTENRKAVLFGGLNYFPEKEKLNSLNDTDLKGYQALSYGYQNRKLMRFVQSIEELPGTKKEVSEIEQILLKNGKEVKVERDISGYEEKVKALSGKSPQVLHLATHGYFPEMDPDFKETDDFSKEEYFLRNSAVFMTGCGTILSDDLIEMEDGVLTAKEIASLNLNGTDLAVLSACQTGLGEITPEGVFGLQRGFKKAGVKALVMSLWSVDDETPSEFMQLFYANWLGGMDLNEAFTEAMKAVRKQYKDPAKWASFVLLDAI